MSKFAIVFFPQENLEMIQKFRVKFDPKSELIAPHITLVYPFVEEKNLQNLIQEISEKISHFNRFQVELKGFKLDPDDNFLHFLIEEGKEKITNIHDELYSGMLDPFWRKDLPYNPHMTIGVFSKLDKTFDEERYKSAKSHINTLDTPIVLSFNNINLVQIVEPSMPRVIIKSFSF